MKYISINIDEMPLSDAFRMAVELQTKESRRDADKRPFYEFLAAANLEYARKLEERKPALVA
ncbi:MAG: hypothetical protein HY513_03050 [Candidatus Aenigmarchaeota archaeon]|nr:hypothetical protein [Candidatus Aenigmarchaeota archaeon]